MATISQDRDRVRIDLEKPQADLMVSLRTSDAFVTGLRMYATQAEASAETCGYSHDPGIDVDAVIDGRKPLIRLRFRGLVSQLHLTPTHAVNLADLMVAAQRTVETQLRWLEERYPAYTFG